MIKEIVINALSGEPLPDVVLLCTRDADPNDWHQDGNRWRGSWGAFYGWPTVSEAFWAVRGTGDHVFALSRGAWYPVKR